MVSTTISVTQLLIKKQRFLPIFDNFYHFLTIFIKNTQDVFFTFSLFYNTLGAFLIKLKSTSLY